MPIDFTMISTLHASVRYGDRCGLMVALRLYKTSKPNQCYATEHMSPCSDLMLFHRYAIKNPG